MVIEVAPYSFKREKSCSLSFSPKQGSIKREIPPRDPAGERMLRIYLAPKKKKRNFFPSCCWVLEVICEQYRIGGR